jgi:hypothetical protein
MKFILLLLLTLNLTFSFSQSKIENKRTNRSTIYIIDESWQPRGSTRYEADKSSYLQLTGEYFVLSERTRGKDVYIEGDIESVVEKGEGIHFWVRYGGRSVISCDIEPDGVGFKIHVYHSIGRWDKYYSSHLATTTEVKKLLENIKK